MPEVLLDTSTLIDLVCHFSTTELPEIPPTAATATAIESLIIYDKIRVDGQSFRGFLEAREQTRDGPFDFPSEARNRFEDLKAFCDPIPLNHEKAAEIYGRAAFILKKCLRASKVQKKIRSVLLRRMEPEMSEVFLGDDYDPLFSRVPDQYWQNSSVNDCEISAYPTSNLLEILDQFPSPIGNQLKSFAKLLDKKGILPRLSRVLPLIRLFYYQCLQENYRLHYVPHRFRASFLYVEPPEEATAKSILAYFDRRVRDGYMKRRAEILGNKEITFSVPPVGDYVLGGEGGWSQVLDRVHTVRNSKEAVRFRTAVTQVDELARERRKKEADSVLADLETAASEWAKSLAITGRSKAVTLTIPFPGAGMELEIPHRRVSGRTTDNLLVFIPRLLERA